MATAFDQTFERLPVALTDEPANAVPSGNLAPVVSSLGPGNPVSAPPSTLSTLPIQPPTGAPPLGSIAMPTVAAQRAGSVQGASAEISERLGHRSAVSRYTGAGAEVRSQEEIDLASLRPDQLRAKYGEGQADRMERAWSEGQQAYVRDATGARGTGQILGDSALDAGNAFVGGLMSLAALGAGAVSPQAGVAAAGAVDRLTGFTRGLQSDVLAGRRRISETRASLAQETNDAIFEREKETVGGASAHLRRLGRGAVEGVTGVLSDPVTLTSGIASGIGSLLGAGKLATGLQAVGRMALSNPTGRAAVLATEAAANMGSRPAAMLQAAARGAPMPAAVGLMEGGGAFQQTAFEVAGMGLDELAEKSPRYRELVAGGMSGEDARAQLANRAGLTAAAVTAPLAAAVGVATHRLSERIAGRVLPQLEQAPLRVSSLGSAAGQMIGEFAEEGLQSGGGAFAQNLGISSSGADPARSLSRGVGEQAGQGAILGLGTSGALQAPGGARAAIRDALGLGKAAAGVVGGAVADAAAAQADRVRARTEEASPLSATNLRTEAAATASQATPEAVATASQAVEADVSLTPEQRTTGREFIDRVSRTVRVDPALLEPGTLPEPVREILGASTDQVDALLRMQEALAKEPAGPRRNQIAQGLLATLQRLDDLMDVDPDAVKGILPDDHPMVGAMSRFGDTIAKVQQSPAVKAAVEAAGKAVSASQAEVTPAKVDALVTGDVTGNTGRTSRTVIDPISLVRPGVTDTGAASSDWRLDVMSAMNQAIKADGSVDVAMPDGSVQTITGRKDREWVNAKGERIAHVDITPLGLEPRGNTTSPKLPRELPPEIREMVVLARAEPGKGNAAAIERVLYHASNGSVTLTEEEEQALRNSQRVLASAARAVGRARSQGHVEPLTEISDRVLVSEKGNRVFERSAARHSRGVVDAMARGNQEEARTLLEDMGKFVEHMSSKVEAVGRHFALGPDAPRQRSRTLQVDRTFKDAGAWGVTPTSEKSVEFAQRVDIEAAMLAEVYNGLVEAFPSLGQEKIEPAKLPQVLLGKVKDVAEGFRKGTRTNRPEADAEATAAEAEAEAKAKAEAEAREALAWKDQEAREAVAAKTAEAAAPAKTPEVTEATEATETPKTLEEAYPGLLGSSGPGPGAKLVNVFLSAFKLPKAVKSRLLGSRSPVGFVAQALSGHAAFAAVVKDGTEGRRLTAEASASYRDLLAMAPAVRGVMERNLREALAYRAKRTQGKEIPEAERTTRLEKMLGGFDLNEREEGKNLNITRVDGKGGIAYDDSLVEQAILAGMQWLVDNVNGVGNLDEKAVAEFLGIQEEEVTEEMLSELNSGIPTAMVKRGLAAKIVSFWGLDKDRDASLENTEGVPESVAAEVARALQEVGLLASRYSSFALSDQDIDVNEEGVDSTDGVATPVKTPNMFTVALLKEGMVDARGDPWDPMLELPQAIEMVALVEREQALHFGEDNVPPAATHQLRNPLVENTPEQRSMISKANAAKFFADAGMVGLYERLGEKGILRLFGFGDVSSTPLNGRDRASRDGKNRSVLAAYRAVMGRVAEMRNIQGEEPWDELAMHYDHNVTRVGRLMMLGPHNPQADKIAREAFLPTWADLDLSGSNQDHVAFFRLAQAQALGVKVHKMMPDAIGTELDKRLRALAPVVDRLKGLEEQGELDEGFLDSVEESFRRAGLGRVTPLAIHALLEQARLEEARDAGDDLKSFSTSLYVEADGVTNGVVNAMAMFSGGAFDENFVRVMAKGGLLFGEGGSKTTLADQYAGDPKDIYETAKDAFEGRLRSFIGEFGRNEPRTDGRANLFEQGVNLAKFMGILLDDVSIKDGRVEIGRGVLKNPLTITLYGSSPRGIAGKVSRLLQKAVHERMSMVAQAEAAGKDPADVVFLDKAKGDVALARAHYARFVEGLKDLTELKPVFSTRRNKWFLVKEQRTRIVDGRETRQNLRPLNPDPLGFALDPARARVLRDNVLNLFVGPMVGAINATIGPSVLANTDLLRKATQVQSIVLQHKFAEAVALQQEKNKADPAWQGRATFPSRAQLDGIFRSLARYAPLVEAPGQTFLVSRTENANANDVVFGSGMNGSMATPGVMPGYADAGVAGLPLLNIGMGDGMMVQQAVNDPAAPINAMYVYDGIHYSVDRIADGSVVANRAAWGSWQGNPLAAVHASYAPFMGVVTVDDITPEMIPQLQRALGADPGDGTDLTPAQAIRIMTGLAPSLEQAAKGVDARQRTLRRVKVHVDQMASAQRSYSTPGTVELSGPPDRVAMSLEALHQEELTRSRPDVGAKEKKPDHLWTTLLGRQAKSGVRVIPVSALARIAKENLAPGLSSGQRAVLDEIRKSLGAKGYRIVAGTPEQIRRWQVDTGRDPIALSTEHGATTFGDKVIYLAVQSGETLIHELVHAATFEKVQAHYEGKRSEPIVAEAIGNLEAQMATFLSLDPSTYPFPSFEARAGYVNARTAIEKALAAKEPGVALNEFMAWGLANRGLVELGQVRGPRSLGSIVTEALKALRRLVFGRRHLPEPGDDFFSNLLFSSAIVMRSQPTNDAMSRDVVAYMSVPYGTDQRLATLQQAFDELFVAYTDRDRGDTTRMEREHIRNSAAIHADWMANQIAAEAFTSMTMQEKSLLSNIIAALSVDMLSDPTAVSEMEKLHRHVVKHLTVEHFMADPAANDPNDRTQADRKLKALHGDYTPGQDRRRRSFLLPVFFGLAATNDQFRTILAGMDAPGGTGAKEETLDDRINGVGRRMMERLSARVSGADPGAKSVGAAMDALIHSVQEQIQQRQTFVEQFSGPAGDGVDRVNGYVVGAVEYLAGKADAGFGKLERSSLGGSSKLVKLVAQLGRFAANLATEDRAKVVGEAVSTQLNASSAWGRTWRELGADLVGRSETKAGVYDRVKAVRVDAQQDRQAFRREVPLHIADQFSRKLEDREWAALHRGLGRTDLASLLLGSHGETGVLSMDEALDLLTHQGRINGKVLALENALRAADPAHFDLVRAKARQLAAHMTTGVAGVNLLRNAEAVSRLLLERGVARGRPTPSAAYVGQVDRLVSLYALDALPDASREALRDLVRDEREGMKFALSYMQGQRAEEVSKAVGMARFNSHKGYIPSEQKPGTHLLVADDAEHARLLERSYVRVGDYKGSAAERDRVSRGYYVLPVNGRAAFNQGIFQTVRHTSGGVDVTTGLRHDGLTAGSIQDPDEVKAAMRLLAREGMGGGTRENLLPVFREDGSVAAFERSLDPSEILRLDRDEHFARMTGVWRGRQVEEAKAEGLNRVLIDKLHAMYRRDKVDRPLMVQDEYVNLFDPRVKDEVLLDAFSLLSGQTREYAQSVFGKDKLLVRRDMLNDALGYRDASVGDVWTGNSRWSKPTQDFVRDLAVSAMGNKGYYWLKKGETELREIVKEAKSLIVVKSVVVPFANLMSNIFHLIGRGVPMKDIASGMARKLVEIDFYAKSRLEEIRIEADLRAAEGDPLAAKRLETRLASIKDSQRRLSIWHLLERGEFSTLTDAGLTEDDLALTGRDVTGYMERLVEKLPERLRNAGRYGLITKDTALFQGLQRSVAYGDFLAKAILHDDLVKRQGRDVEYADGVISEEFVNYELLPGRTRGYLESVGLLWFWNFKVRYAKIALSVMRNNPVHAFLASLIPLPSFMSSGVDMPTEGSLFHKLADGSLDYSIGLGQGIHSPMMHPLLNLAR